jgi:hypothetical protein
MLELVERATSASVFRSSGSNVGRDFAGRLTHALLAHVRDAEIEIGEGPTPSMVLSRRAAGPDVRTDRGPVWIAAPPDR